MTMTAKETNIVRIMRMRIVELRVNMLVLIEGTSAYHAAKLRLLANLPFYLSGDVSI